MIKSKDIVYLHCSCLSHDHTVRAILDDDNSSIWITYDTKPELSVFKRAVMAIKFLFGRQQTVGEVVWDKEVIPELRKIIKHLEKK